MKTLVLSDIHGNLEALNAVLHDVRSVDEVVCLGDLVGYGASPNEVVARVRELGPVACLAGNHDLAALGRLDLAMFNTDAARAAAWTGLELHDDHRAFLDALKSDGKVNTTHLAHASPRDPVWEYMDMPTQGPPNFAAYEGPLCFVGHTHVPRVFEQTSGKRFTPVHELGDRDRVNLGNDVRMIINPGSVGQPRDGDWRASYGLWDATERWFELRRVEYPVEETQARIVSAGLPRMLADRLAIGR